MKMVIRFCSSADLVDCPDHVITNRKHYQQLFLAWLYDKSNDHGYWWYEDGRKAGVQYGSEEFIKWLNTHVLLDSDDKASLLEGELFSWDENLPMLHF